MENTRKKIALILGTAREGRQSIKAYKYLHELLRERDDIEIIKVDVKDFSLNKTVPPWIESEETKDFRTITEKSDAFIIITPEYNHSIPGELKIILDQAMKEYLNKPVLVAGVSAGGFGGARVVESIIPILSELGLRYIAYPLYFSNVEETFKLDKETLDGKYKDKVNKSVDELLKAA